RVGSSASTPLTSSAAARQVASQSVKRLEQESGGQLWVKVGRLLRQHAPGARALEHLLDLGRPEQERRLGLAAVDGGDRLGALRRVGETLRRQRIDNLDVQAVALEQLVAAVAVEDDAGERVRRLVERRSLPTVDRGREAVRRKDRQALLARRDEDDHHPGAGLGSVRLVEGQRRLVAVMAVRDQQLSAGEA